MQHPYRIAAFAAFLVAALIALPRAYADTPDGSFQVVATYMDGSRTPDGGPIVEIGRHVHVSQVVDAFQAMYRNSMRTADKPDGVALTWQIIQAANVDKTFATCHIPGDGFHTASRAGDTGVWANCPPENQSIALMGGPYGRIRIPMVSIETYQQMRTCLNDAECMRKRIESLPKQPGAAAAPQPAPEKLKSPASPAPAGSAKSSDGNESKKDVDKDVDKGADKDALAAKDRQIAELKAEVTKLRGKRPVAESVIAILLGFAALAVMVMLHRSKNENIALKAHIVKLDNRPIFRAVDRLRLQEYDSVKQMMLDDLVDLEGTISAAAEASAIYTQVRSCNASKVATANLNASTSALRGTLLHDAEKFAIDLTGKRTTGEFYDAIAKALWGRLEALKALFVKQAGELEVEFPKKATAEQLAEGLHVLHLDARTRLEAETAQLEAATAACKDLRSQRKSRNNVAHRLIAEIRTLRAARPTMESARGSAESSPSIEFEEAGAGEARVSVSGSEFEPPYVREAVPAPGAPNSVRAHTMPMRKIVGPPPQPFMKTKTLRPGGFGEDDAPPQTERSDESEVRPHTSLSRSDGRKAVKTKAKTRLLGALRNLPKDGIMPFETLEEAKALLELVMYPVRFGRGIVPPDSPLAVTLTAPIIGDLPEILPELEEAIEAKKRLASTAT